MKKNILVVDDSALMRRLISDIIVSDERFEVVDVAINGIEAFDLVVCAPKKYDAIILDINMPKMNGIEFLEQLEKKRIRQKVIIVSTLAKEGAKETIRCLELGAFDFVTKPESFLEAKNNTFRQKILVTLGAAVGLNVGGEKPVSPLQPESRIANSASRALRDITAAPVKKKEHIAVSTGAKKLVALACSTGGPKALQQVIPKLPKNLAAPVILVQHMPEGFTNSLAQRLNDLSALQVKEAEQGEVITKGTVYIARGGSQMRLIRKGDNYTISLTQDPPRNGLRPCADIMYESLLDSKYEDITCVVLTGMGGDGTLGIKQLNEKKNIYVIAQDEATSTVYGMPKVVRDAGLTDVVVPLEGVANAITKIVGVQ